MCRPWMGWNCWDHYKCQFIKLYQGEVGQSFEQIWRGSHCSQHISNTNSWVYGLSHPLLNLMGCEKFMCVARNCHATENNHVFFVHILQYLLIIFEIEVKWSLLEEALLSFEEDIFGLKWKWEEKYLEWTPHYIALMRT